VSAADGAETYEVVAVRYGTRQARRSHVYLNYHLYGEPDGPIGMDYFFWVVRNDRRTIVVDTGFSEQGGSRRERTFPVRPAAALRELGIDPDTCTVVLTHAHYDHAGNLDLFPNSPIHLTRAEYEFWTSDQARRFQYHHSVEDADIDVLRGAAAEGRLRFTGGTMTVAPGVRMIELRGHTPGQSIVTVDTADGLVVLASDAAHYYEELERDMPFCVVDDLKAMYAGFDHLKRLVADHDAVLVPGHDPDVVRRFEPVPGVLDGNALQIRRAADRQERQPISPGGRHA
jgi:glyoxylase-like metal-dependent hydrolase (beta-lactamase superfamily II)